MSYAYTVTPPPVISGPNLRRTCWKLGASESPDSLLYALDKNDYIADLTWGSGFVIDIQPKTLPSEHLGITGIIDLLVRTSFSLCDSGTYVVTDEHGASRTVTVVRDHGVDSITVNPTSEGE